MKIRYLLAIFAIAIIIVALFAMMRIDNSAAYASSDELAAAADPALVSANTRFAFTIFKQLTAEDSGQNVFISPLSISTALAMAYNGANGETRDGMTRTLELNNMSLDDMNIGYLTLIQSLEHADSQVTLSIVNSMWMREEFEPAVRADYRGRVKDFYESDVLTRDFSNPQTVNEINGWISEETQGMIPTMIDTINPQLEMFLINAIYFRGDWVNQFKESQTRREDFHLADGTTTQVDMMSTSATFGYYKGADFAAARLPYGRDKIAMYVFLPDENTTIDAFIATMDDEMWTRAMNGFHEVDDLQLKLPKFKLEYGKKRLNDALAALGMGTAFQPGRADFTGIAPRDLYIGFVDHKAVIKVDEKGSEAAAVTVIGVETTNFREPITFFVDRPFFFVIRDDRSGTILFMGKAVNPPAYT